MQFVTILWLRNGKKQNKDIEVTIAFFRSLWGKFVLYVLSTSIIGLFIASFVLDKEVTLVKMNEWVSLVLGLVALIIGIISLYLSFYNVDQAYQSQKDFLQEMEKVQQSIERKINSMHTNMKKGFDDIKYQKTKKNQNFSYQKKNQDSYGEYRK